MKGQAKNSATRNETYSHWLVFILYLSVLAYTIYQHELWGDELHSWNIAKGSTTFKDLITNTRYEGHPPIWYILLFLLSKITHHPNSIQILQFCICFITAFVFLFQFQFSLSFKIMILFGYYFLYEYGAFSRNYSIGIGIALWISIVLNKNDKKNYLLYYGLLFLLSNTHFLALILAFSFHVYFISITHKKYQTNIELFGHILAGLILLIPAFYFIFPPSNSSLNTDFWISLWNKDQIFVALQAPLKALSPIPAWWEYHFWNTSALLQTQKVYPFLKFLSPLLSLTLIGACVYVLYDAKKSLIFFIINLSLTIGFALVFPLTTARYVGFIFVGFVIALLLVKDSTHFNDGRRYILYLLFSLQLIGSLVAINKEWRYPFSSVRDIKKVSERIPAGKLIMTDYWCLNYLSAFLDKPIYCLGFNTEKTFLLWDKQMSTFLNKTDIYTSGTQSYFREHTGEEVYLLSNSTQNDIHQKDSLFFREYDVTLVSEQSDAIERYSNMYLYKVKKRSGE